MVEPTVGHNSGAVASAQLQSIVERIERLNEEKSEITEQIKEVFAEAKGNGYSVKIIRKLIALRQIDPQRLSEDRALLELYAAAVGASDLV